MIDLSPWLIWIIVAVLLFILEIFTPGFLAACLGFGCLGAGLGALIGLDYTVQGIIFMIFSLIVFFGVRPIMMKHFHKVTGDYKSNVDALVGKPGLVIEAIDSTSGQGRVKVSGEDWRGAGETEQSLIKGSKVRVLRVEGTKLIVEPISGEENK